METAGCLRYGVIVVGLVLIAVSFWTHASKRMHSDLAVAWCLLGAALAVMGIVPALYAWMSLISLWTGLALFVIGVVCLCGVFKLSTLISQVQTQSKELAMQITLLLQENRWLRKRLEEMEDGRGEERDRS